MWVCSIPLNTKSVAQNCWKGISFSWRTLLGTFSREHLRQCSNIKQGYEMLHYTAIPSSACVAYRMNFNDNSDIFWGRRKLIQGDGIHWSQLRAEVLCKNLLHGLQILLLKCLSVSKAIWGDTQKHMESTANLTLFVHHWSPSKDAEKERAPSSSTCHELFQSLSGIMKHKWLDMYECDGVTPAAGASQLHDEKNNYVI